MTFDISWVRETTSTNADLLCAAKRGDVYPRVLVADHQRCGRGRMGRPWLHHQDPEGSLLFSVLWPFSLCIPRPCLSLMVSVVLVQCLRRHVVPVCLKWPNDLYLDDAKLGGVLIETHQRCAVIGVGLNIYMPSYHLDRAVIGLSHYASHLNRQSVLKEFLPILEHALPIYDQKGFVPWQESWNHLSLHRNKKVHLVDPYNGHLISYGLCLGVDQEGKIRVWCEQDRNVRTFVHGEVRLCHDAFVS